MSNCKLTKQNTTQRLLKTVCATTAAIGLSASLAMAATIYDESVSGDLDAIGSTNVNLGLGVNDILGSIPETGAPPDDSDRIKFTQLAGQIVDSILLSFTSAFDPLNLGTIFNLDLHNDQANLFDDNFLSASSGATISASFFDSFGMETGPLTQTTAGTIWDFQISPGTVFPFQDWKLTINTSAAPVDMPAIPLPAALPLFGTGIAIMGFMGWRRKRKFSSASA